MPQGSALTPLAPIFTHTDGGPRSRLNVFVRFACPIIDIHRHAKQAEARAAAYVESKDQTAETTEVAVQTDNTFKRK